LADDDGIIAERLKLLEEYIAELRDLQDVTFQEYLDNKFIRKFVERTLQTALEACLDIGHRFISIEGFRYPSDNKDVFAVLVEEKVLPWELLPTLQNMVGFRNVLVHEYAKLDHAAVYGVFKKRLGDFDAYAEAIVSYLGGLQTEAGNED